MNSRQKLTFLLHVVPEYCTSPAGPAEWGMGMGRRTNRLSIYDSANRDWLRIKIKLIFIFTDLPSYRFQLYMYIICCEIESILPEYEEFVTKLYRPVQNFHGNHHLGAVVEATSLIWWQH